MHIINFSYECGGFDNRLMRGGLSPLVWNLSREYAARGHRVSVITPAHGHLDRLRETFPIEELDYRADHVVPLVLDPAVWPDHPAEVAVELTTRAYRLRLDGVDVYFLSNAHLDLLPDRLYPPPGLEGRDLAHFKPLVFQVEGVRFIRSGLPLGPAPATTGPEPAIVHGFEPYYHYLLPPVLAADPRFRTVSTVAANAPVGQQVHRPQVERLLALLGAGAGIGLDALDGPPPPEDSPVATIARALAGTRMHQERRPDHVGVFPLVAAHADLVDFVSPGQRAYCSTFEGTPFEALFATLPVARELRTHPHKLLMGGCGVAESWLARDPAGVDRAAVLNGLGLDPARPVFFHAARYAVHHKGQLELMRAVEDVLATDPDISFVIRCATGGGGETSPAGPTAANAYFQSIADRYPGQVHLDWRLADEDTLFEQAACADFCVNPSKYELDGFLIAQAEAMACGAVPIATDQRVTGHFGHARPLTDPTATGFSVRGSFRDDDPVLARELAGRIREAAAVFRDDPDTYDRLSANARRVARRFTWPGSAELRLTAFGTLLRGERLPFPAEDAIAWGWFDALDDADFARHGELIAGAAAERGDAAAYARCAPLDGLAMQRLFEAAYARADFARCAELAETAKRDDWTARLAERCRVTPSPEGDGRGWRVEYVHAGAERVEVVVESTGVAESGAVGSEASRPGAVRESVAEAVASDEAVPVGSGVGFVALRAAGDGTFHGVLDRLPVRRELVVMVTLRSGRVAWDAVPVAGAPPPYRVVATDLDGTLLRGDLSVSDRTRRALALATGAGAHHLVVTGRPAAACREFLTALGYRGIAVCGQGAQLYDAGADRLLDSARLDLDLARSVVDRVEDALGTLELGVVTAPPESRFKVTPRFGERVRHGWDVTADRAQLWSAPIDKLVLHHPDVPEDELAGVTEKLCGDDVSVVHSVKGMVEVLPLGTTKGAGVARAARLLGFTAADTIAFGDMPNDIPLLAWAAHGVAVSNAHPELRAMADEVAPSNDEDGVAVVLERLFTPTRNPAPALASASARNPAPAPIPTPKTPRPGAHA
ncbi:HAD-IIB family hydrolase [Streptomyces sp. NPDC020607]|uniref:HAD-IIB family hydrolase n=1 Tax=Streptomyces sp. NPDC020607 TaxID=3365082 RepID=UPI00379CA929